MTSGCSGLPKLRQFTTATGCRTDARQVGHALGQHERGARPRVERARPRVGIGREGDAAHRGRQPGAGEPQQRRIGAGAGHRVQEELVVVLAVDPTRRAQQREEVARAVGRRRERLGRAARRGVARAVVEGRVVGERGRRHVGQHRAVHAVTNAEAPAAVGLGRRHRADDGGPHLPLGADGRHRGPGLGRDDGEHALLALARHHLPGLHAVLAPWHGGDVHVHADAAAARRLARGAGQAGAAEVLDPDHELGVEQLQTGFDQPLLLERVAHLHARSLGVVRRPFLLPAEPGGGQDAHPADAVASGARAEQHGQVPRPRGDAEHQPVGGEGAHAEHVHEGVLRVAGVEGQLPADGRHPDRVAVARDPAHHALDQPALAGVVGRSEEERVHDGERPGPHGEDVAQDAAHPRGRALVGLDRRGVVVALDPDGHGDAVPGVDHPGVLARADEDAGPLGGQPPKMEPRRLVGAVLAPHHGVEGQLEVVGRAAQDLGHGLVLVVGQAERPVQVLAAPRPWCSPG